MYWVNSRRITAVQRIYAGIGEREEELRRRDLTHTVKSDVNTIGFLSKFQNIFILVRAVAAWCLWKCAYDDYDDNGYDNHDHDDNDHGGVESDNDYYFDDELNHEWKYLFRK